MAKASGLAPSTIHRIWREHGVKPHRVEAFKLSNDPKFVEKVRDIVGLYVNPPEHILVLSVNERIQATAGAPASRTARGLRPGLKPCPKPHGAECDGAEGVSYELVKAGGEAADLLAAVEASLDRVALAVEFGRDADPVAFTALTAFGVG
jgi:hypothetical protein